MRMKHPDETRVVVTGIGTVNPVGSSVREYWENLLKGKSGIRRIRNVDIGDYHVQIAGEVDIGEEIIDWMKSKKLVRRFDRYITFGYVAAAQALHDSGLDIERAPHRYGVLIGSGDGGIETHVHNVSKIATQGMQFATPFYVVNSIPNSCSGYFAQRWNLQGPSFSINSACATSNHAIGIAAMMIKMGLSDAIFAGGSEAPVNRAALSGFGNIQALSTRNDSPEMASRPFDVDRDGFVISEGAGALCLEELEHAKRRGATIYCELSGFGCSCDAYDFVAPHPEGRGATNAMRIALAQARLSPDDIDLVNVHATSTQLGDLAEYRTLRTVFGDRANRIPVQSTKSMTGHTLGAAGGLEAIAIIHGFVESVVHPTINQCRKDPEIDLNIIDEPQELHIDHAISNGFGFGGQNAVILLSRYTS